MVIMAKRGNPFAKLSKEKQIATARKILANPRTPPQLKPYWRKRLEELEK